MIDTSGLPVVWGRDGLVRLTVDAGQSSVLSAASLAWLRDVGVPRKTEGGLFYARTTSVITRTTPAATYLVFGAYQLHESDFAVETRSNRVVFIERDVASPDECYVNQDVATFMQFLVRVTGVYRHMAAHGLTEATRGYAAGERDQLLELDPGAGADMAFWTGFLEELTTTY